MAPMARTWSARGDARGWAVLTAVVLGCGAPPSEPTPSAPATAPSTTATAPTTAPATTAAAPVAAPAVPPAEPPTATPTVQPTAAPAVATPDTGLPPVTAGPAIRLESTLPITTREAGGRRLASVTLADPTAQAALDAWFERNGFCRGRVQLAIDGFVSYDCRYSEPAAGGGMGRLAMNARITEAGAVEPIREADVFLPGTDVRQMIRVWADDPHALQGEVGFGPAGAIVVAAEDDEDPLLLPWRTIAPYVRADGPLGPALAAQGLTLAAPGTAAPPTPMPTTGLAAYDGPAAMALAAILPPDVRAGTRLRVGHEASVLLLPPGTDAATLALPDGTRPEQRYPYGAVAELVPVRVDAATELHEGVGPRTPVVDVLPPGTTTFAARGAIGSRTSELGTGWVLLAGRGTGGYAQGRHVSALEGCGALAGAAGSIGGYAELGPDARFAWTLTPRDGASTVVTVFPVGADCTIGEQVRRASVAGRVTDLRLVRATADGPDWLLVVVSAGDLAAPARSIAVLGATPDAPPLYSTTADAPALRLAERRGPDRAPGYFPITIASGDTRTWLAWNGTTLEAIAP